MGVLDFLLKTQEITNEVQNTVKQVKYVDYIYAFDGTKVKKSDIPALYDLDALKKISNNFYLIGREDRQKASEDILYVNPYLRHAKDLLRSFPACQFREKEFSFTERLVNGFTRFCFLTFIPYTKTGKLPKYPIILHAHISDNFFGELYYGRSGEIDKAKVIVWSDRCYELDLAVINGALDINAIYVMNPITQKKQKMYFIPPAKG